ncbi:MAG: glycosyl transferase [Bacteroidales bacterium]|nr:glycosyl transferase [Bacteroidales bacterium]
MRKHAFLIIAHNEFDILRLLVSKLDDLETDIFIHFDRKVKTIPIIKTEKSGLFILDKRIDVHWGSVSQIKCELALFEEAAGHGPYEYYHLLSGVHLPLKPIGEILSLFDSWKDKCILSGLCQSSPYQERLKVRSYNLFLKHYSSMNGVLRNISQFLWKACVAIQRVLGIKRNREIVFYKASNWLSITQEAVDYILSRKKEILSTYRYSFCGDEYFIPSELMSSPLSSKVIDCKDYLLHNISRSNASTYRLAEYEDLCKTGYLFARKFTK